MSYQEILRKVAIELNLPVEVVRWAYESHWAFVKETITSLPLKGSLNEEDFSKLRTNFNIPSLGKLSCTYERMLGVKKRFEYIKRIREK